MFVVPWKPASSVVVYWYLLNRYFLINPMVKSLLEN
jgi:hypothetical protein